jgi:predicted nuclease of predicted toxin-antitoxin system
MALRFLADHCISNTIVQTLRDTAHDVVRLKDVLPVESPDATVIAKAQEIDAILLSMNGDFADIVTYPPQSYKGIVALQMRNHAEVLVPLMLRLIGYLRGQPAMEHYRGKLLVVEVNRIRIRE